MTIGMIIGIVVIIIILLALGGWDVISEILENIMDD